MNPDKITRRHWVNTAFAIALHRATLAQSKAAHAPPAHPTPADVIKELKQGNERFIKNHIRHPHDSPRWAKRTSREGQHPHAVVLCCSDSRVSPELIFDQGLGDLFVVRVIGNVANEDEIASIEYATEHLGVPLVLVMGHAQCGAVSATVMGEELPKEIAHETVHIRQALDKVLQRSPDLRGAALIEATVHANVLESVDDILRDAELVTKGVANGSVQVVGAVYDLESGRVTWVKS